MGLLSCVDTNLDVQLAVGVGLLGNLLGHDVGHGRQGIVVEAGASVDATLVLVLRVVTLEVVIALWSNTGTVYEYRKGLGAFVAIDDEYYGMIHESEIFSRIEVGDTVRARVVKRRPDGKTDLALREEVYVQRISDSEMVYDIINSYGGELPFDDKADKELIRTEFGISKNAFKRAVGHLLKEKKVEIRDGKIVRTENEKDTDNQ